MNLISIQCSKCGATNVTITGGGINSEAIQLSVEAKQTYYIAYDYDILGKKWN